MEMSKRKRLGKIPKFKTKREEIEFWDTHDSTEYIDWSKAATLKVHPSVKSPRDLSPRCPHDKQVLLSRWRNLVIADGFVTLNNIRELYCPRGDYARLAPESKKIVQEAEAAFKRIQKRTAKIAA